MTTASLGDDEAKALAELLSIVQDPNAPNYANLPQVDLASRWYVILAGRVEYLCESLGIEAEE